MLEQIEKTITSDYISNYMLFLNWAFKRGVLVITTSTSEENEA